MHSADNGRAGRPHLPRSLQIFMLVLMMGGKDLTATRKSNNMTLFLTASAGTGGFQHCHAYHFWGQVMPYIIIPTFDVHESLNLLSNADFILQLYISPCGQRRIEGVEEDEHGGAGVKLGHCNHT